MKEPLRVSLVGLSIRRQGQVQPCLALYSLRGYARSDRELRSRVAITVHDLTADLPVDEVHRVVRSTRPQVVGLSCFLWSTPELLALAKRLKEEAPACRVFLGGPDAGPRAATLLSRHPAVDGVLAGEGEEPFRLLLRALAELDGSEWNATPGLVCRRGGEIAANALPEPPPMARIPFIHRDAEFRRRFPGLWIGEIARGCGWRCAYCAYGVQTPRRRQRPLGQVFRSWRSFSGRGGGFVCPLDAGINQDRRRFRALLEHIAAHPNLTLTGLEINLEQLHPDDIPLMAGRVAGVVAIGLQSTNEEALRSAGRRFRPEVFADRAALLREHGIAFGLDVIYGLPGDDYESFRQTLNDAYALRPRLILCFPLQVLPGSAFWREPGRWSLSYQPEPPYRVLSSDTFSGEDLARAERLALAHDLFQRCSRSHELLSPRAGDPGRGPAEALEAFLAGHWRSRQVTEEELAAWADPAARPGVVPALEAFLEREVRSPGTRSLPASAVDR